MPKLGLARDTKPAVDRGGRPAVISRERVLEVARQLRSHELTMNAVAERLGVQRASLYYHFKSRQDLIAELGAEAARGMSIPPADPANWRRWLERAANGVFEMLCANPVFLELDNISSIGRAFLPLQESALETLEDAGFDSWDAVNVWRVISSHAYVAATNIQQARHADINELTREAAKVLAEAELVRPMPRLRTLLQQPLQQDPRRRFADALAWQVGTLPDPRPSKSSKPSKKSRP